MTRPSGTPAIASAAVEQVVDQAITLHENNQFDEAEKLYAAALALDPDHPEALVHFGLLRLQQNRGQESVVLMRRAIERDPASGDLHAYLGGGLQSLGAHDEALTAFDRASALGAEDGELVRRRAHSLHALGRNDDAITCYESLIAREPADGLAQLGLATVFTTLGRSQEAFVHYRNAAAIDPNLAGHLSQALNGFAQRNPDVARAGVQRLNQYIGTFLTNHASARMGQYSGLTSAPFHDPAQIPGVQALEREYQAIRAEIDALAAGHYQPEAEGLMDKGSWDVFLFHERGRKNEQNCARCPTIDRIITNSSTVRTMAGLLYVSKLSPGTRIKPHVGPTNQRLRCHLGIRIPHGDCGLKVGGETRRWEEGKCIVFDDSLEHEAWNFSPDPRIVLIIDFWHPDLTPAEIAYLEGLHRFASFQAVSLNRYWAANEAANLRARRHYD